MSARPIVLLLFPQDWDMVALPAMQRAYPDLEWVCEGFDLFKFPQNARLLWFDPERFVSRVIKKYGATRIAAVMSTHEQFGALCAALIAERLNLPGTPVDAVLRAQHKALARELHAVALPESVPPVQTFTFGQDAVAAVSLPYPFFVKPVKAAYSVLAKRINSPDELRAHTRFAPFELHIIKRLTKPFNRIVRKRLATAIDGDYMMAETLLSGTQVNVDGYAFNGEVSVLGTVDAVMYPGTSAFMRFELPSRLPASAIAQIERVAKRAIETLGFSHGLFNVELFWDEATQRASIIEVNPRMAAQFGDLYEKVRGTNLYSILAELSFGRVPIVDRAATADRASPAYGAAASFVYRVFDGEPKFPPTPVQLAMLKNTAPDAIFTPDFKYGASREREQRWLGSHRYALLNLGGRDHDDLMHRYQSLNASLNFDTPPSGWKGFMHALRRAV